MEHEKFKLGGGEVKSEKKRKRKKGGGRRAFDLVGPNDDQRRLTRTATTTICFRHIKDL